MFFEHYLGQHIFFDPIPSCHLFTTVLESRITKWNLFRLTIKNGYSLALTLLFIRNVSLLINVAQNEYTLS